MKAPGKTTLDRMQLTAFEEMERIQIVQDFWVRDGARNEPDPDQVRKRDDFAGIVRLIDIINSDGVIIDRLKAGLARAPAVRAPVADPSSDVEVEPE
ncbi:hypothetical protein BF49_3598 [Bradyrhizobium sp.]|uniref:hypothetical protein n=1 Tax=Bradyrhizobium sp. TaxID=376 RepID=UPI0007C19ACC|nr:hypothetical protein [Bradyrhizobium sp.]CUT12518.1 hypothetical protein BF49_3598 [Bradyrhizobium sp.]